MSPDSWLRELYDANYSRLYKLASYHLRDYPGYSEDVQDVLQEVFLTAAQKDIRSHPKPEAWLVTTTKNICKNYIRANYRHYRKKRKNEQGELQKVQQTSLLFVTSKMDEIGVSDIKITLEQVLSPNELRILELYCLEKWPLKELSREFGMTPNAIRVWIFRIRQKIKKYL